MLNLALTKNEPIRERNDVSFAVFKLSNPDLTMMRDKSSYHQIKEAREYDIIEGKGHPKFTQKPGIRT